MRKSVLIAACLLGLAACAKSPSSIAPVAIASAEYEHLDCTQLAAELSVATANLEEASTKQNGAQAADAVGVFLVLIPVSALVGDAEAEVAQHKGESQAIQRAMDKKNCTQS